jgi:hypothetical protein
VPQIEPRIVSSSRIRKKNMRNADMQRIANS